MRKIKLLLVVILMIISMLLPVNVFGSSANGEAENIVIKGMPTAYGCGAWVGGLYPEYHLLGGNSTALASTSHWVYRPIYDSWTQLTDLPQSVYKGYAVSDGTSNIFFTTVDADYKWNDVYAYNVVSGVYTAYPVINSAGDNADGTLFYDSENGLLFALYFSGGSPTEHIYYREAGNFIDSWTHYSSSFAPWESGDPLNALVQVDTDNFIYFFYNNNWANSVDESARYTKGTVCTITQITDNRTAVGDQKLVMAYERDGVIYGHFDDDAGVPNNAEIYTYDEVTGIWSLYDSDLDHTATENLDYYDVQGFFYNDAVYFMHNNLGATQQDVGVIVYPFVELSVSTSPYTTKSGNDVGFFGNILHTGYTEITERGVQWVGMTELYPEWELSSNVTEDDGGYGIGSFGIYTSGNFTANTVYWFRMFAKDTDGYKYGSYYTFTYEADPSVSTNSASSGIVNGSLLSNFVGSIDDDYGNTCSVRGFEIGTASGVYSPTLRLSQIASSDNSSGWDGSTGEYNIISNKLSANTTYYYRAFATQFVGYTDAKTGYGEEKTFTTVTFSGLLTPVIELHSVYFGYQNVLSISGEIMSSPSAPLSSIGARYGTISDTSNVTWWGSTSIPRTSLGLYTFDMNTSTNLEKNTTVYVQTFAQDSLGNIGYSDVQTIVAPETTTGTGGLTVENTSAVVDGNSVVLTATITNPAQVAIYAYAFQIGETVLAIDRHFQTPVSGDAPSTISKTITGLEANTVYYYKSSVSTGGMWVYSTVGVFTTGGTFVTPNLKIPTVATSEATEIGLNYFTANGNLLSHGSSNTTRLGFAWSTNKDSDVKNWASNLIYSSTNYSLGSYSQVLSFDETNQTIYYVAIASNIYGASYGNIYYVSLGSQTTTPSGVATDPTKILVDWLARYGLNNTLGRWGLVLIIMVLAFLIFKDVPVLKIGAPLFVLAMALVSAFISEWWIILLIAILVGGIIAWVTRKALSGGN